MNENLLRKNNIYQYENLDIIDFLKYKESKKEHIIYPETYVYSNDFYKDIRKIVQALENHSDSNAFVNIKKTGNVKNNVKKVKLSGILLNKKCNASWEEMKLLNLKYENSIPKVTISYMALSAFASGIFVVFFLLSLFKGINVLHPVMSLLFSIGFIGLFFTAFTSIFDWRKMLDDVK